MVSTSRLIEMYVLYLLALNQGSGNHEYVYYQLCTKYFKQKYISAKLR